MLRVSSRFRDKKANTGFRIEKKWHHQKRKRREEMAGRKRCREKQKAMGGAGSSEYWGHQKRISRIQGIGDRGQRRPDKGIGSEQVGKKKWCQEKEMSSSKSSKR